MQKEVAATIKRNLEDARENRLSIVDPEGTEFNFPIGPNVHVQTDGRWLSFNIEVGGLHNEEARTLFTRALSGF